MPPETTANDVEEFISSTDSIHDRLKALRLDELITLAQSPLAAHTVNKDIDGKSLYCRPAFDCTSCSLARSGRVLSKILGDTHHSIS